MGQDSMKDFLAPHEPAFSIPNTYGPLGEFKEGASGLTKREYIAIEFMKSWLTRTNSNVSDILKPPNMRWIIEQADLFIEELNK